MLCFRIVQCWRRFTLHVVPCDLYLNMRAKGTTCGRGICICTMDMDTLCTCAVWTEREWWTRLHLQLAVTSLQTLPKSTEMNESSPSWNQWGITAHTFVCLYMETVCFRLFLFLLCLRRAAAFAQQSGENKHKYTKLPCEKASEIVFWWIKTTFIDETGGGGGSLSVNFRKSWPRGDGILNCGNKLPIHYQFLISFFF